MNFLNFKIFFLFLVLTCYSSCVQVSETTQEAMPSYQQYHLLLKEGEAFQHFQRGNTNFESIRASGKMLITDDQNGFIQETSIILLANNKNQVFLRGYQALSPNLYTFWINGNDFLYYLPQEDTALKGNIATYDQDKYDFLLPPELISPLFFPFSIKKYPLIETRDDRKEKTSHFTYEYPDSPLLSKIEVLFSHTTLFPEKLYFFNSQEILIAKVEYSQINLSGNLKYPKEMMITWPQKTKSISFRLKKMLFNSKLSDQVFRENLPKAVQIKDLT